MAPVKRALIIASPFGGLLGPLADAAAMKRVLQELGFEVEECCDSSATRQGVLDAWQRLIDATCPEDTVVIYYTGHGALVRPKDDAGDEGNAELEMPEHARTFQVLVPMDYDQTTDTDFRGILNIEISYLLRNTTAKTRNVTIIADCCHSGSMFRGPGSGVTARPRNLPKIAYHSVASFLASLRNGGHFHGELDINGNPHAVRIAASTVHELAMEYMDAHGVWRGALTEALISAMQLVNGHDVSWRTILMHVRRIVQARFPLQHPRAEGPGDRMLFSLQHVTPTALQHFVVVGDTPIFQAGTVFGIRKGNTYAVMPLGPQDVAEPRKELPEATVIAVTGFSAQLKLNFWPSWKGFSERGALAFLKHEVFEKLPVVVPFDLEGLQIEIEKSKYLRYGTAEDNILAEFKHIKDTVMLCNHQGIRIASRRIDNPKTAPGQAFSDIIMAAERLARAQRVMNLQRELKQDRLTHSIDIEIGTVKDGNPDKLFQPGGPNHVTEGESIYIQLENRGTNTVHVSIFNINVAGRISFMTPDNPTGYELCPDETETFGDDGFNYLKGVALAWPDGVQRLAIDEQFLFVLTSSPIELRDLADSVNYDLAAARDVPPPPPKPLKIRYDIIHVPVTVHPKAMEHSIAANADVQYSRCPDDATPAHRARFSEKDNASLATDLDEPDAIADLNDPLESPQLTVTSRGYLGALLRINKPSCVWVVNLHSEEITVVVSQFAPNRMLSGIGINGSLTGLGIELSTTTFSGPATRKTLAAHGTQNGGSEGVFPLWTRKEGFGVITIFRGPERTLYTENDWVPMGATVYFRNTPDLEVVEYGKDRARSSA
ncbi:caspase domain-containing protein [Aspergillus egyptiacus]|nr:caspase domain-containing protein [Aspergillus egyptiacus]